MSRCAECGWSDLEPPAACARLSCPLRPVILGRRADLMKKLGHRPSEPVRRHLIVSPSSRDPDEGLSYNWSSADYSGPIPRG